MFSSRQDLELGAVIVLRYRPPTPAYVKHLIVQVLLHTRGTVETGGIEICGVLLRVTMDDRDPELSMWRS